MILLILIMQNHNFSCFLWLMFDSFGLFVVIMFILGFRVNDF